MKAASKVTVGQLVVHKTAQDLPIVVVNMLDESVFIGRYYNRITGEYESSDFTLEEILVPEEKDL